MDFPDCEYKKILWTECKYNKRWHCTAMHYDKVEGSIIGCAQALYLELCPEGWR